MRKIFTALDIGSNTIKVVVGEFIGTKLNILSAVKVTSRGYVNNYILDKEALISRIKEAISKTEEELNIKIRKVILNVPTYNYNKYLFFVQEFLWSKLKCLWLICEVN